MSLVKHVDCNILSATCYIITSNPLILRETQTVNWGPKIPLLVPTDFAAEAFFEGVPLKPMNVTRQTRGLQHFISYMLYYHTKPAHFTGNTNCQLSPKIPLLAPTDFNAEAFFQRVPLKPMNVTRQTRGLQHFIS